MVFRWYRSPELLVGDPRYGKEVDIWAVGCLFSEMMTGEPLFPGESDIDQLFQIIRVIGKLNARHQLLVTRNAMFKGMKQEQNTSLHQMFPDWNHDCLDFLQQCLKMDGNQRPDTEKLLKHDMFTRDSFLGTFLVELRHKLNQELQGNPLLKRMGSHNDSDSNKESDTKKSAERTRKSSDDKFAASNTKERSQQIGLTLGASQFSSKPNNEAEHRRLSNGAANGEEGVSLNLTALRHYLNNHQQKQVKPIAINNLVFNENNGATGSKHHSRGLSAKHQKSNNANNADRSNGFDMLIHPPSPVQFQSLQTDSLQTEQQQLLIAKQTDSLHQKSIGINGLSLNANNLPPQYFTQKRSSNLLGLQQVSHKGGLKPR